MQFLLDLLYTIKFAVFSHLCNGPGGKRHHAVIRVVFAQKNIGIITLLIFNMKLRLPHIVRVSCAVLLSLRFDLAVISVRTKRFFC